MLFLVKKCFKRALSHFCSYKLLAKTILDMDAVDLYDMWIVIFVLPKYCKMLSPVFFSLNVSKNYFDMNAVGLYDL